MKMAPLKCKVMAFKGQVSIRSLIVIESTTLGQVNKYIIIKI